MNNTEDAEKVYAETAFDISSAPLFTRGEPVAILFYMIGCPHCIDLQPAWLDAKSKSTTPFIHIESMNARNPEFIHTLSEKLLMTGDEQTKFKELVNGITGFPTMIKVKEGIAEAFPESMERNSENILKWVNPVKGGSKRRRAKKTKKQTKRNHKKTLKFHRRR